MKEGDGEKAEWIQHEVRAPEKGEGEEREETH